MSKIKLEIKNYFVKYKKIKFSFTSLINNVYMVWKTLLQIRKQERKTMYFFPNYKQARVIMKTPALYKDKKRNS